MHVLYGYILWYLFNKYLKKLGTCIKKLVIMNLFDRWMMFGYVQTSPVLLSTVAIFKVHWWGPSHTPHVMDDCTERTDRCPEAYGGRVRTLQTGRKLVCNKPVGTGVQICTVYTLPMSTYRIPKLWKLVNLIFIFTDFTCITHLNIYIFKELLNII